MSDLPYPCPDCAAPVPSASGLTDERLAITDYPDAARSIALSLAAYCDESLPYPSMIADAARRARSDASLGAALREALATMTHGEALCVTRDGTVSVGLSLANHVPERATPEGNALAALLCRSGEERRTT